MSCCEPWQTPTWGSPVRLGGAYQQAIACCRDAIASLTGELCSERLGQVFLPAVFSRSLLPWCLAEVGAFTESMAVGTAGLEIAEASRHPASLMRASFGVGLPYLLKGDTQRAIPTLERALTICQSASLPVYFPDIAAALGTAYALAGRSDEAVALLEQTVTRAQATAYLQQSLTLASDLGMRPLQAHCHRDLGMLYQQEGQPAQARAEFATALTLYRALEMTYWLPQVETAWMRANVGTGEQHV